MTAQARIAVIGAGLIGQAHIRRVLQEPGARLAGIADPAPQSKAQAEALGIAWAPDIATLLTETKPDGVVIATPNRLHVPHGMEAIRAKVPMLVEKPIADDVERALALTVAAEQVGVPILVGHHRRHSVLIQRAKAIIASGRLGRLIAVNGLSWFRKPADYFDGNNAWRRRAGGGVVLINLIHVIDDLRNLCGDVVSVQAAESTAARGFEVEDTAAIVLRFANGALGTLTISDAATAPWSWEMTSGEDKAFPHSDQFCYIIGGTKASVTVPRLDIWSHTGDGWRTPLQSERVFVPEQDPLTAQMRHFVDVIRGKAEPIISGREGTRTLEATLAVKRAAASGTVIRLDETIRPTARA